MSFSKISAKIKQLLSEEIAARVGRHPASTPEGRMKAAESIIKLTAKVDGMGPDKKKSGQRALRATIETFAKQAGVTPATVKGWVTEYHKRSKTPARPKASKKATVAARPDVVRAFVKRLEECLGDEGFTVPYRELKDDTAISNAEVVAIARTFTSKKPASRPKALQAIWSRHHALLVSQAKSDSRGGRSAA